MDSPHNARVIKELDVATLEGAADDAPGHYIPPPQIVLCAWCSPRILQYLGEES